MTFCGCCQNVVVVFSGKLLASKFKNLMYLKAFRALAEPGEAVGLLAAQVRKNNTLPQNCKINVLCGSLKAVVTLLPEPCNQIQ